MGLFSAMRDVTQSVADTLEGVIGGSATRALVDPLNISGIYGGDGLLGLFGGDDKLAGYLVGNDTVLEQFGIATDSGRGIAGIITAQLINPDLAAFHGDLEAFMRLSGENPPEIQHDSPLAGLPFVGGLLADSFGYSAHDAEQDLANAKDFMQRLADHPDVLLNMPPELRDQMMERINKLKEQFPDDIGPSVEILGQALTALDPEAQAQKQGDKLQELIEEILSSLGLTNSTSPEVALAAITPELTGDDSLIPPPVTPAVTAPANEMER